MAQAPSDFEALPAALAAAASNHTPPAASPATGSMLRRPSFQAAASRAAAEVQQLANKLKSALLNPRQAAGRSSGVSPTKSSSSGVAIRVMADGSRPAAGRPGAKHASVQGSDKG